jgi:hypothetical protein
LVLKPGIEVEPNGPICQTHLQNLESTLGTFQVNGKARLKKNCTAGGIDLKKSTSKPWKANISKPIWRNVNDDMRINYA